MKTMAQYANMAPITLSFTVTFDGVTPGGKCRAVDGSVVLTGASGPNAELFGLVVTKWGDLLALDTRLAKRREPKAQAPAAPAPAPLTAAQKAQIPANGTKARKGKVQPAAEPAAQPAAQPDMAAIVAAVMAALGQK